MFKTRTIVLFTSILLLGTVTLKGQKLNTPYQAVYTHLKNLMPGTYNPSIAATTMYGFDQDEATAEISAIKLKKILDAKGLFVEVNKIPGNENYFDSSSLSHRFILFPEYPMIYVEKYQDQWLYSKETVRTIPALYKKTFPFGEDLLVSVFPTIEHNKILNLYIWQWIGLLILFIVLFIIYKLLSWIFGYFIYRIVLRFFAVDIAKKVIRPVARPLSLLLNCFVALNFWPMLQFSVKTNLTFTKIFIVLAYFFAMLIFYKLVDVLGAYLQKAAKRTESTLDDQLVPLVNKSLKIFVIIIGTLFILQNLDMNITALLAGVSIGGLAFALAAQDTIKNLFGSMMIFLDKPFQIGDWIVTNDVDGTVEEVGFRSTKVRTFRNSLITIPNSKLADQSVDNMGAREYRRLSTTIAITYDTHPDKIETFVTGIREIIKAHPHTRKDYFMVELNEMAAYSLNVMVYMFFKAPSWDLELKYKHQVLLSIIKLAEKLKIRFAFPTYTQFIEEIPGQKSLTPREFLPPHEQRKRLNEFMHQLRQSKDFSTKESTSKTLNVKNQQQQNPSKQGKNFNPIQKRAPHHDKQQNRTEERKQQPKKEEEPTQQQLKIQQQKLEEQRREEQRREEILNKSVKQGRDLENKEIEDIARDNKVEVEALKAVIEVEGKTTGFFPDGKPIISFEGHKFWKELEEKGINPEELQAKNPNIIYPRWTKKYYLEGVKEYERLEKAKNIDKEAAYKATGWGRFKVFGSFYPECGFNSVHEFVYNHYQTEKEQLEAFVNFLKNKKIIKIINEHNWTSLARRLNGPSYARNGVHTRLEKAYYKYKEQSA